MVHNIVRFRATKLTARFLCINFGLSLDYTTFVGAWGGKGLERTQLDQGPKLKDRKGILLTASRSKS